MGLKKRSHTSDATAVGIEHYVSWSDDVIYVLWYLPIVFENYLQTFSCEENAAFDGAEWKSHLLCDLAVFVSGDVHGERYFVFWGEGVDGF